LADILHDDLGWERKSLLNGGCKKYKRGGIVMRKLVRIAVVLVIMIGTVSGVASGKTLFVAAEDQISNSTANSPADAFAVNVRLTTYNNQCMILTFSSMATVQGTAPLNMALLPEIDGTPALPTEDGGGRVYFNTSDSSFWDTAGFTWYRCGLNIGSHTVAIRYFPLVAGKTAVLGARLLKIDIKSGKIVPSLTGRELEGAELEDE
jgi:hypothetical protein